MGRLTDKDKDFLCKNYGRGKMTSRQIAEYIGCDEHTVKFWAKRMNLERGDVTFFSEDNDAFLRDNFRTMPYKDIASHYGCHYTTVSNYIKAKGLLQEPLLDSVTLNGITYKKVTDSLHVSRDGRVLHYGKPHKTNIRKDVRQHKVTAQVNVHEQGKNCYYQLSRLVAKAWKCGYTDGCYILYKDGDIHNVHADNLIIASEEQYTKFLQRNSGMKAATLKERKEKLQHVIEEANITLHYLQTGDITPLNRYVENRLFPILRDFCRDKLYYGLKKIMHIVPECIARLYEIILSGACIYNYERFCKQMLMNYKKNGAFGHMADIPKPIEIIIEQLNTNCLWERYKVSKLK